MPSPTVLDVASLIEPVPGDNPAGVPLPFETKRKLDSFRKEINPDDYDEDDPRRPKQYQAPDWQAIIDLAQDTLKNGTKDLLVAVQLCEAMTIVKGFPGLRDSLDLLSQTVEHCWDRCYPLIEEGDTAEVREGCFRWFNQARFGALFPMTIRQTPMIEHEGVKYSAENWLNKEQRPKFEAALSGVDVETCRTLLEDVKLARQHLDKLNEMLADKMGEFAPDMTSSEGTEHIGAALRDCSRVAQQLVDIKEKGSADSGGDSGDSSTATSGGGGSGSGNISGSLASRADAYRMLNQAADLLQRIEPHSPIPYLVKRAVKLGDLKFPELMRALIRENAVIDELNRLMGIEPPPEG